LQFWHLRLTHFLTGGNLFSVVELSSQDNIHGNMSYQPNNQLHMALVGADNNQSPPASCYYFVVGPLASVLGAGAIINTAEANILSLIVWCCLLLSQPFIVSILNDAARL